MKAKEILLQCLCFPCCCCCWIKLDEPFIRSWQESASPRFRLKYVIWESLLKITDQKLALMTIFFEEKMLCCVSFLEYNAKDVLDECLLIGNMETSCWTTRNVEWSSVLVCLTWRYGLSLTWKPWCLMAIAIDCKLWGSNTLKISNKVVSLLLKIQIGA